MSISIILSESLSKHRAVIAGVKCRPSGKGNSLESADLRTTRMPLAVSRIRPEENAVRIMANSMLPIRRMGHLAFLVQTASQHHVGIFAVQPFTKLGKDCLLYT